VADGRRGEGARGWAPVVAVVAILAVSNVMSNRVLPSVSYVPWNVAVTATLLAVALGVDRCGPTDLGLGRARLRRGLLDGALAFAAVLGVYLIGLALPPTRELFDDARVRDTGSWGMLFQAGIRIPFGTVLLEEVAFRGVLLGMLLVRVTPARAVLWSCAAFGLWHVLPGMGADRRNPVMDDLFGTGAGEVIAVVAVVVATGAAGVVFCWLRLRSGSLAAPILLHIATNGLGFVIAWWYLRLR
jgi:membrane protease YdiL (CAAX protease family)